ncbi:MAG: cytochrome P450 [Nocardioidaceae bacterium]
MRTITDLPCPPSPPLVGNALRFRHDRLGFLTRCAREYGDAVRLRLGPVDAVLLSHPDAVHDVLTARVHDFHKGPVLQRARAVLGDGLLTSEGETHRHDRRMLQAVFHPRRISAYSEAMTDVTAQAVRSWDPGKALDMHAEMVRTTLTVAGRSLFATRIDDDVPMVSAALTDLLFAYGVMLMPFGRLLLRLPPTAQRLRRGIAGLDDLAARLVREHRSGRPSDGADLLSVLLADEEDPRKVRDQVVTLLLAAHETTAGALANACHLLAEHAEVQEAVAGEVMSVCGTGGVPTEDDLERFPSVRAVLAEALRLYPPSWAMGRQARCDTETAGIALPSGTVVLVSQWVVHRDPRWWPSPERFDPSRFDAPHPGRPRSAYFPFGGGTRQCLGEGFAMTEGVLTLATILARWRLRAVPGRELTLDPLLTLRPRDGVWLVPERRR